MHALSLRALRIAGIVLAASAMSCARPREAKAVHDLALSFRSMRTVVALMFAMLLHAVPSSAQDAPMPVGTWYGRAALDSGDVRQGTDVALTIAADGAVTGTVGAATLANARIERNPSILSRLFGLGTTWVIAGELRGPIRAHDNLTRSHVKMPVSLIDGELRGDLNASGGGRLLSVQLRLEKQ